MGSWYPYPPRPVAIPSAHTHAHTRTHTHKQTRTHTHALTHIHAPTHTQTHTHEYYNVANLKTTMTFHLFCLLKAWIYWCKYFYQKHKHTIGDATLVSVDEFYHIQIENYISILNKKETYNLFYSLKIWIKQYKKKCHLTHTNWSFFLRWIFSE